MTEGQHTEPTENSPTPPKMADNTNQGEAKQPKKALERQPDGPIAGVASGIADHFELNTIYVQLAFVALTVFGGSGVLLYIAGVLVMPVAGSGKKAILGRKSTD